MSEKLKVSNVDIVKGIGSHQNGCFRLQDQNLRPFLNRIVH